MMPDAVLDFWFVATEREAWFKKDAAFDAALRGRFEDATAAALRGDLDAWGETADGSLALLLLLDQFQRNLGRGTAAAFAGDPKARDVARRAVANGLDKQVSIERRVFFYLPFEHSESAADQEWSVALIETLNDAQYLDYAQRHQDVIDRFGRFPHRNEALGRASTPEEEAYLAEPGAGF